MLGITELTAAAAVKTPCDAMLELSEKCLELGVTNMDVYGDAALTADQSWLKRFEDEVAGALGLDGGLFMCSGVMAQDIALSVHAHIDEPCIEGATKSFVVHYSSHILLHEQNAYSSLLHLSASIIPKDESAAIQRAVTYSDVSALLAATPRPSCVVLECPHREIGGKLTLWEDLVAISEHCRRVGVPLHMDGARLWEAAGGYGKCLAEVCSLFDTVYVSFYKGLGGLTGAMLLGSSDFISKARVWQRRFGGVVYTQLPYAVSSWAGFRTHKDAFSDRLQKLKSVVHAVSEVARNDANNNSKSEAFVNLLRFDPPVPEVSMIHAYMACTAEEALTAKAECIKECNISCFARVRSSGAKECYFEFNMV